MLQVDKDTARPWLLASKPWTVQKPDYEREKRRDFIQEEAKGTMGDNKRM
jgi:hypothetical protein